MFASLRMVIGFLLLGLPGAAIGIPWTLIRGNVNLMYAWGMVTMRFGLWLGRVRVRVIGRERFPRGEAAVVISNHISNLDPPILLPLIPGRASVFLKAELMKIPILGTVMKMGHYVPVTRGNSREEARHSVNAAAEVLRSGWSVFLFPEGTRSADGRLLPFRKGAFFLSVQTGAPIAPMILRGTDAMMPKGTLKAKPGTAEVEFLDPVRPLAGETPEELMRRVRAVMEAALAR
jgi:1-acyl-sn-glycerol-3-phosphate acyltransferase